MEIALLINERIVRASLTDALAGQETVARGYSTASDAIRELSSRHFDLIVLDWKIYPGYGCSDAEIRELASLIPDSPNNENLLYWQVALKVLDHIRDDESLNRDTQVIFRMPKVPESYAFGLGDELTKETILTDVKNRGPLEVVYDVTLLDFIETIRHRVNAS